MTETHQPFVPPGRGVDAVAGCPPVPLNVWYRGDDTPGDARRDLIRQAIEQYSQAGQAVLMLGVAAESGAPPWPAARRYVSLPGWRDLAQVREQVDLVLLAWAYTAKARIRAERGEVFGLLRAHLADAGHAVLLFDPPAPGVLPAAYTAGLITAAARAGLGYRQSVGYVDTGLRGPFLDTTRLRPGPRPWPPGWQHQAQRYLLVLSSEDGRHG